MIRQWSIEMPEVGQASGKASPDLRLGDIVTTLADPLLDTCHTVVSRFEPHEDDGNPIAVLPGSIK